MNKKRKRILTWILLIGMIAIFILLYYSFNRTLQNEDGQLGNTAGNLYNGGLFCEYDGRIYFSNFNDDGALYSMDLTCSDVEKIATDKPAYLNIDDHYIYYARINNTKQHASSSIFDFYNVGIYRIDHDGKNTKMLYKDPAGLLSLYGNKLFYQHYTTDTGITFYSVNTDGRKETKLSDDPILPASYYDGRMYYAGALNEHGIHAKDMKTGVIYDIYDGNCYMPVATVTGIYFISLEDNYALCRIDFDGTNKTVLVDKFVSSYNISEDGNTIIYQVDGGDSNRIVALDIPTMATNTLLEGNYKNIHMTSSYVFFRDFNEQNTYAYQISTDEIRTFHPPVIE